MPDKTGLSHTIHASESIETPCFIIDSRLGNHLWSDVHSKVFAFGEKTGDKQIDKWLHMALPILQKYCANEIDTMNLIDQLSNII